MLQKYKKNTNYIINLPKKIYFLFLTKIYIPHFQPNKKIILKQKQNKHSIYFAVYIFCCNFAPG